MGTFSTTALVLAFVASLASSLPRVPFFLYPSRFQEDKFLSIWYDSFWKILEAHPWRVQDPAKATAFFLGIDVACAFLWPVYGGTEENFVIGNLHSCWGSRERRLRAYIREHAVYFNDTSKRHIIFDLLGWQQKMDLIHNKDKGDRVSLVAPSLSRYMYRVGVDISWPTLPVTVDEDHDPMEFCTPRKRLAVFQGTETHPTRRNLQTLHNGEDIVVNLRSYKHVTDAKWNNSNPIKASYAQLMRESEFALVPRGDNLFSVRLVEGLSFGTIPVILADNWVLPFPDLLDWRQFAIIIAEHDWKQVPSILREVDTEKRCAMRKLGLEAFHKYLGTLEANVKGLFETLAKRKDVATHGTVLPGSVRPDL